MDGAHERTAYRHQEQECWVCTCSSLLVALRVRLVLYVPGVELSVEDTFLVKNHGRD